MPVTQHAPTPIPLPMDDKPSSIPPRSPSYSTTPKVVDPKPIVSHQDKPDSPPPSIKPSEPPKLSQSPSRSSLKSEQSSSEYEDELSADDIIDMETFQQILELDDSEDDREFSREMVWAYFSQAEKTFGELDEALEKKDLDQLSALGHFLKGSSAALGVSRVQAACEKIQHYGQQRDEENDENLSKPKALDLIRQTLEQVKKDYAVADKWLRKYYNEE